MLFSQRFSAILYVLFSIVSLIKIPQGRSAGDEKDTRPHHRIPGPHHRRGARRDLGDQGHRAGGQAECGCGREEGQGETSSWHSLTFNHELVDWWRNWRRRAVLWHLRKQPGWQGILNVDIQYGDFEAVSSGERHFLKGCARAQENTTSYQRLINRTKTWLIQIFRVPSRHMYLWSSILLTRSKGIISY